MDTAINQAQKKIEYISYNEEDYRQIILREQALLDYYSDINASKKEEAIKIAKNLLDVLDIITIANKTNLTVEEVEMLSEEGK